MEKSEVLWGTYPKMIGTKWGRSRGEDCWSNNYNEGINIEVKSIAKIEEKIEILLMEPKSLVDLFTNNFLI